MNKVKIGFPVEYEDENNIVRNGLFLREPEIKELEKRLKEIKHLSQSYYDLHEKYYKLQQENKRLKDNWNKLKEIMEEETREYWDTDILEIMQELEQGSDSNVNITNQEKMV